MITLKKRRWRIFAVALVLVFAVALELKFSIIDVMAISQTLTFSSATRYAWDESSTSYDFSANCVTDNMSGTIKSNNVRGDTTALQIYASDNINGSTSSQTFCYSSDWSQNDSGDQSGILFNSSNYDSAKKYLIIKTSDDSEFSLESFFALDCFGMYNNSTPITIKVTGYCNGSTVGQPISFNLGESGKSFRTCNTPSLIRVTKVVIEAYTLDGQTNNLDLVLNNIVVNDPSDPPPAPSAPIISKLGSESAVGSNPHYTNDTTPTFEGTANAGNKIYLYKKDDPHNLNSGATVNADGSWQVTSEALEEGTYQIVARAENSESKLVSEASEPFQVIIDTTAPVCSNITNNDTFHTTPIKPSSNDTDIAKALMKKGSTEVTGYVFGTTQISEDGSYELTLTDKAGNSSVINFTIDTTVPNIINLSTSITSGSSIKSGTSLIFSVKFSENIVVTDTPTLSITVGSSVLAASGNVSGDTLSFTYTVDSGSTDADGIEINSLTTSGTIKDAAGNDANLSLVNVTTNTGVKVDTAAPVKPTLALSPDSDTGAANDNITNDTTPTLTGSAEPGTEVEIIDSSIGTLGTVTVPSGGVWTYTVPSELNDRVYIITATSTDAAGNNASSDPYNITIRTTKPVITTLENGKTYNSVTPTFTNPGDLLTLKLSKDGGAQTDYTAGTPITANGSYTLTATNIAGNQTVVSFTIDSTAPRLLSIVRNGQVVTNADTVEYTVTFSKNVSGVSKSGFCLNTHGTVKTTDITVTQVSGSVYNVTISGVSGDGGLLLGFVRVIPPVIHDDYGNYIGSDMLSGPEYTIDNTPIAITNITDGEELTVQSIIPQFDSTPASVTLKKSTDNVAYTIGQPISGSGNYTLTATDAAGNISSVGFKLPKSDEKKIKSFIIGSAVGTVNETAHTIAITVPYGSDVTKLTPTIAISNNATVSPSNGAKENFTAPVTYTVTAEDSSTQSYTVTVTVAPQVTTPTTTTETTSSPPSPPSSNSPADPPTTPSTPTKTITIAETPTGIPNPSLISIKASPNAFNQPVEVRLKDNPIARKAVEDALKNQGADLPADAAIFPLDISLYIAGTNTKVQPNSGENVEITCPIPESLLANKDKLTVVCVIDGKLTVLPVKLVQKDGVWCITFTASHFSPYALVVDSQGDLTSLAAGAGAFEITTPIVQNVMPYFIMTSAMILLGISYKKIRKEK